MQRWCQCLKFNQSTKGAPEIGLIGREKAGAGVLEPSPRRRIVPRMKLGGAICSECRAGFSRVELESERGTEGDYRFPLCGNLVEKFDGNRLIAYRLTSIPPKYLDTLRTP